MLRKNAPIGRNAPLLHGERRYWVVVVWELKEHMDSHLLLWRSEHYFYPLGNAELLPVFRAPPPPIGQLVQVQWPAWTIPVSFSSTEQIAQPSKERQASFMKQLLLRWDCETDTHMHTSHDIIFLCVCGFFWLFLRQGTKLLSKISQWTLLLFLRTEKGKVKKEPCLSSFPSPSQPRLKTLILRMEQRWQRSRKWGLVYLPAL